MSKFNEADRTFETRLNFIKSIFTNKYTPNEIMAHCIEYKLGKSYDNYLKDVKKSMWNLDGEDPIKILKKIDK